MTTKKISITELLQSADVYSIIGIDQEKVRMPFLTKCPQSGQREIIGDPTSLGAYIFENLQPALESLALSAILKHSAPYIEANFEAAKVNLSRMIDQMIIVSSHRYGMDNFEEQGLGGLKEKVGDSNLEEIIEVSNNIAEEVAKRLGEKINVLSAAADKSAKRG